MKAGLAAWFSGGNGVASMTIEIVEIVQVGHHWQNRHLRYTLAIRETTQRFRDHLWEGTATSVVVHRPVFFVWLFGILFLQHHDDRGEEQQISLGRI